MPRTLITTVSPLLLSFLTAEHKSVQFFNFPSANLSPLSFHTFCKHPLSLTARGQNHSMDLSFYLPPVDPLLTLLNGSSSLSKVVRVLRLAPKEAVRPNKNPLSLLVNSAAVNFKQQVRTRYSPLRDLEIE